MSLSGLRLWKPMTRGSTSNRYVLDTPSVSRYLSAEDIENLVNPDKYIGTAVEQVETLVVKLREAYSL